MKRKVIQVGDSTQLVSLPREWSLSHNIKKGDELDVVSDGSRLIINANAGNVTKSAVVFLTGMQRLKRRSICAAYLNGCNEVEVHYSGPEYIPVIQSILPEFTGFEIVKQGKTSCVIKQISIPQPGEYESVFNRLFLLLHDTMMYIIEAVEKGDKEMLHSIQYREMNINKFSNFCRRLINTRAVSSADTSTYQYNILSYLEELGDESKALASHLSKTEKVPDEVQDILRDLGKLLDGVYHLHTKWKKEDAVSNAVLYDHIVDRITKCGEKKHADCFLFHYLMLISKLIILVQENMLHMSI